MSQRTPRSVHISAEEVDSMKTRLAAVESMMEQGTHDGVLRVEPERERSEGASGLEKQLDDIVSYLHDLSVAAMRMSGMIHADIGQDGILTMRPLTDEEKEGQGAPRPIVTQGRTSTRHGSGGPLVWVLSPPEPYSDAVIVCSPDATEPVGMRCHVEKKEPGGVRRKFKINYEEVRK